VPDGRHTARGQGRARRRRDARGRPETIDETGDLIDAAGGNGSALRIDHLEPAEVEALIERIDAEQGRLDVLVTDIFGAHPFTQWDRKLWEHDLDNGLRILRMGVHTHLITATKALPLMLRTGNGLVIEMTDGTSEYNRAYRRNVGFYYDQVKAAVERIVTGLTAELEGTDCTAVAVTPGWMRSEQMLDDFGVMEETWRDALERVPHFCVSETPTYVARGIVALCADLDRGRYAGRVLSSAELARVYGVTDIDGSQPDSWRYLVEIQETGRPATELGYR
jgi:NAD(P)-dependent dehydrogenase (short-subunit alcohol dehydrogenase family)